MAVAHLLLMWLKGGRGCREQLEQGVHLYDDLELCESLSAPHAVSIHIEAHWGSAWHSSRSSGRWRLWKKQGWNRTTCQWSRKPFRERAIGSMMMNWVPITIEISWILSTLISLSRPAKCSSQISLIRFRIVVRWGMSESLSSSHSSMKILRRRGFSTTFKDWKTNL